MKECSSWKNLENIAARIVCGLGIIVFFLLSATALFFTRYFAGDYSSERPYNRADFFVVTAIGAVILAALSIWLGRMLTRSAERAERNLKILLALTMMWVLAAGLLWIHWSKTSPFGDQRMVFGSAQRFLDDNYGRMDYGKYLYCYPFQLGLTAWESLLLRVFRTDSHQVIQVFNALGASLCVYSGYKIVRLLSDRIDAAAVYLFLMAGCFPLIILSAFIYNDIQSLTLCMAAIWQFLRYMKEGKRSGAAGLLVCLPLAVLIRNNSLIVMIAVLCIFVVKAITGKRWSFLCLAAVLLVACLRIGPSVNYYYEQKSGKAVNDGMPFVLWIAMGMQEGEREAGWYNEYSMILYADVCKFNSEVAEDLGVAEIKARVKGFLRDPLYALDFYSRKFTSQWNDPTYECFVMTYGTERERSAFGESLYTGIPNRLLEKYMDSYQLLVYASCLFLLVMNWRKGQKEPLEWYVLLVAIIGGVLFHQLWEAKSRYILPYFIMMIPMAATGLSQLSDCFEKGRRNEA